MKSPIRGRIAMAGIPRVKSRWPGLSTSSTTCKEAATGRFPAVCADLISALPPRFSLPLAGAGGLSGFGSFPSSASTIARSDDLFTRDGIGDLQRSSSLLALMAIDGSTPSWPCWWCRYWDDPASRSHHPHRNQSSPTASNSSVSSASSAFGGRAPAAARVRESDHPSGSAVPRRYRRSAGAPADLLPLGRVRQAESVQSSLRRPRSCRDSACGPRSARHLDLGLVSCPSG